MIKVHGPYAYITINNLRGIIVIVLNLNLRKGLRLTNVLNTCPLCRTPLAVGTKPFRKK